MSMRSEYIDARHNSLFAFVGIDGAGKSTLINGVFDTLQNSGVLTSITKAYSGERKAAFEGLLEVADDIEIMFMFQSFYRRQRNETIKALEQGHIVLADRWGEAFDEYHTQNGPLSIDARLRHQISRLAFEGLEPCRTFYVQLNPLIARERLTTRSHDFFDQKPLETHVRQARYYDERALEDNTWKVLDGHSSPSELVEKVVEVIEQITP